MFFIQNGLKQGDALTLLLLNFASEYATKKAQENQVGLKLNGTHQLLVDADVINLMGDHKEKHTALLASCFQAGFLLGSFFGPEDGGDMILRNVC
jgi:hypothetical protein